MDSICYREDLFKTADNLNLYEQSWRSTDPVAVVVIMHGYAEHSGRYKWFASQLVDQGFAVYTFDLRGHGKSSGERCFVRSVDDYLADLETFLQRVELKEPSKPLFLFGHSMGGAISTLFTMRQKPMLSGLVLSSGVLGVNSDVSPLLVRATMLVGHLMPKLPTLFVDSRAISRDPEMVRIYETDPLVYHGRTPARTSAEILKAIAEIQSRTNELKLPLLILHGTEDRLANMEGSKNLYSGVRTEDKLLKLYDGLYHELLNEPEKVQILSDIEAWLRKHLSAG